MSKAARHFFFLCLLAFGMAHAGSISKSGSGSVSVSGSSARYSHAPGGSVASPNSGYQVQSSSPLGVLLQKPLSPNASAGTSVFEELLRKPSLLVEAVVAPKALAKGLVNPWSFAASAALQPVLGYLANQACIRIAGGQMTNTGGLWEECKFDEQTVRSVLMWQAVWPDTYVPTPQEACEIKSNHYSGIYAEYQTDISYRCKGLVTWGGETSIQTITSIDAAWRCPNTGEAAGPNADCGKAILKRWQNVDSSVAQSKVEDALTSNPNYQSPVFQDLFDHGVSLDVESPAIIGPSAVNAGDPVTMVKTNPDGSTENTTQQFIRRFNYSGDTITHTSTTTEVITNNTTNNNNTTTTTTTINTPTNAPINSPTNSPTNAPNSGQNNIETCGLPGKPPCKIDETGTPEADESYEVEPIFRSLKQCLENPTSCFPAFPDLSWSFSVPSGCAPIPVHGFNGYINSIDICPFQSVFHDLMSMIWVAAGLFGASAMLFRDSQGA